MVFSFIMEMKMKINVRAFFGNSLNQNIPRKK